MGVLVRKEVSHVLLLLKSLWFLHLLDVVSNLASW